MDLRNFEYLILLSACVTNASGQNTPRLTLFTGYSHMRGLPVSDTVPLNGWVAELTVNLTRRFGLAANLTGNYGSSSAITGVFTDQPLSPGSPFVSISPVTVGRTEVHVANHSLLLGPALRLNLNQRIAISLNAGIGGSRATLYTPLFLFMSVDQAKPALASIVGFAAGGGAGADIRITNRLAYRAVEFRFVGGNFDFGWQRSLQLATGLVLTLAK